MRRGTIAALLLVSMAVLPGCSVSLFSKSDKQPGDVTRIAEMNARVDALEEAMRNH